MAPVESASDASGFRTCTATAPRVIGDWSAPRRIPRHHRRSGYVEISFTGDWSEESRQGSLGPVRAFRANHWVGAAVFVGVVLSFVASGHAVR